MIKAVIFIFLIISVPRVKGIRRRLRPGRRRRFAGRRRRFSMRHQNRPAGLGHANKTLL